MTTVLGGGRLTIDAVLAIAESDRPSLGIDAAARVRVAESWALAEQLVISRPVYGRSTGVGANRDTAIARELGSDLRLLRSHATGSGRVLDRRRTRMAMVIRLNQLLRGGSGIHPDVIEPLRAAIADDCIPAVHAIGAIGTGDLSAMAEIALALMGDDGEAVSRPSWHLHPGDALPFVSSSAVTLASACAAVARIRFWMRMHARTAALSFLAARASRECLRPEVQAARPHVGQTAAAAELLELLRGMDIPSSRVQDSYGFRAFPPVAGALVESADTFERVVGIEIDSASENPLIDLGAGDVFHNGNFHGAPLALAADQVKLAMASVGQLSVARLTELSSPGTTGLTAFLAEGPAGSSGVMQVEYNQAAAQAALRHDASPASLGTAVISRGVENHSSFSTQAVDQLHTCLDSATDVLACELVVAVRALVLHGDILPAESELAHLARGLARHRGADLLDRPLSDDLGEARRLLAGPHPDPAFADATAGEGSPDLLSRRIGQT